MTSDPAALVPAPPCPLTCNTHTLPAGTVVHRIHDTRFRAEEFNPGIQGNSRFAPISTAAGTLIPTCYAATTFACAAYETIFHDIDPDAPFKSVAWTKIASLSYSTLTLERPLRMASFFSADLMKWGLSRTQLVDTAPTTYPKTRLWAAAVHESDASLDGMIWTSRKFDEAKAMLIFGTRVPPGDFSAKSSVVIVSDANALGELHALARRSGILITR